ncbi:MAG TPA: sensor histidine kinase [Dongiaceae bacterium]|nr:sensor histidine kinase [Dongiaceae bacterium]
MRALSEAAPPGERDASRRARSLTARLTLVAALGALPVLIIAGGSLLWLFADRIERRFDAFLAAYQQQLIAAADIAQDGSLHLSGEPADPHFDLPFSGWYWQIRAADRVLAQSASAGPLQGGSLGGLAVPGRSGAVDLAGPGNARLRAVAREVRLPGTGQAVQVVVAGPHAEIDQEVYAFGVQLALALGGLGIAFLLATVLQVRYGLLPLDALRRALHQVRKGATPRLAGDYPIEVAPLVEELNEVLEHNEALISRARVQAGNLAHGLKSPLTVLRQELAGIGDERGDILRDQVERIGDQVERVLARIRAAGPLSAAAGRTRLVQVLRDLAFSLDIIHRERGIRIEIACADDAGFLGDAADLAEMLGNLMDNGCKWANRRVLVTVDPGPARLAVLVDDDGPGIAPARRDAALTRGGRLDETAPGTGLGLDIVQEIAELYRGSLRLEDSPLGGLRARLDLPAG